jgi:hypothetical protein
MRSQGDLGNEDKGTLGTRTNYALAHASGFDAKTALRWSKIAHIFPHLSFFSYLKWGIISAFAACRAATAHDSSVV